MRTVTEDALLLKYGAKEHRRSTCSPRHGRQSALVAQLDLPAEELHLHAHMFGGGERCRLAAHKRAPRLPRLYRRQYHPLEGLVHVLTVLPAHQLSAQRENDGNSLCDMSRTDMTEPAPTP